MIIALDPGASTGICTFNENRSFNPNDYKTYQIKLVDYKNGRAYPVYPHPHEVLYDHLSELKPTVIIYESFQHRQGQTGAVYKGVEFIGVIELWQQRHSSFCDIAPITPGQGKGFWSDRKLKQIGLWNKNAYPHGMDALRLMLSYQLRDSITVGIGSDLTLQLKGLPDIA